MKMNHHHHQLTRRSEFLSAKTKKKPLINMANCSSSANANANPISISKFIFLWLPVLMLAMVRSEYGNCAKLPDIYWNSSNPIFRIDNTDHIFDVNKKQHDHDQVDIVCPQPLEASKSNGTASNPAADQERYIIYSVSKEEYDTCRVNGRGRVVAVCDSPEQLKKGPPVTITFRSFTPQPNGLEFAAGQDYYFISALFGHHHDPQRRFSPCREHNMKVIFKVCCKGPLPASSSAPALARAAPASAGNQLGRRPPASSVITLRPALQLQQPKQPANEPNAINSYFDPLPGSPFGSGSTGSSAMGQPITVLPIEVLSQPASSAGEQPGAASGQQQQQQQPSNDLSSSTKDDILAEQPQTPSSSPPPPPPPPQSYHVHGAHNPVRRLPANAQPQHPFVRFSPQPEPAGHLDRWAPTPLPGELHRKQLRFPPASSSQPAWLEQAGWPAQYHQQRAGGLQATWNQPAASRGSFYWSTFKPSYEPPTKELISIQEEQSSSSAPAGRRPLPTTTFLLALGWLALFVLGLRPRAVWS